MSLHSLLWQQCCKQHSASKSFLLIPHCTIADKPMMVKTNFLISSKTFMSSPLFAIALRLWLIEFRDDTAETLTLKTLSSNPLILCVLYSIEVIVHRIIPLLHPFLNPLQQPPISSSNNNMSTKKKSQWSQTKVMAAKVTTLTTALDLKMKIKKKEKKRKKKTATVTTTTITATVKTTTIGGSGVDGSKEVNWSDKTIHGIGTTTNIVIFLLPVATTHHKRGKSHHHWSCWNQSRKHN